MVVREIAKAFAHLELRLGGFQIDHQSNFVG
jgi:hypothetical protein